MAQDDPDVIFYFDRQAGGMRQETVLGDGAMKWAYRSLSGRLFAPLLFGNSILSRLHGWYARSRFSRRKIARTIADLGIDMTDFARAPEEFTSFNDFFTRELRDGARPFDDDPAVFVSPADGRILVHPEAEGRTTIRVKGLEGCVRDLFDRPIEHFEGGAVAVVRLCPADYHRYHFPTDGTVAETGEIRGRYDSVNPVALAARPGVFRRNKRSYALIETDPFGPMAFVEVGAFGVAGIHQTYEGTAVSRMQEKGYFDFGGSTIVLAFTPGAITFDADLVENSARDIETLVRAGETIGRSGSTGA